MARCVSPARGHPAPGARCSSPSRRGLAPTVASPPCRPEPAAWTHSGLPCSGCGRLGASDVWTGQVRGRQDPLPVRGPLRAGARSGRGQPPASAPVAPRGGRGEEAGGGVGSVRPEGSPSAARSSGPPARPPAQPRGGPANSCCEPTAAPAGAPARTCPGEVRPCLPHRASGLGKACFRGRRSGPEQAPGEVESGSDPGTERLGKVEPGAAPGPRMFAPG